MATGKSASSSLSAIKPWQIVVLAIALLVLGWRLLAYIGDVRKNNDVKLNPAENVNPYPKGSKEHQKFEEK
jgi:hypothetical protein